MKKAVASKNAAKASPAAAKSTRSKSASSLKDLPSKKSPKGGVRRDEELRK